MNEEQERIIARGIQKREQAVVAGKTFAGIAWTILAVPAIWFEAYSGHVVVSGGVVLATALGLMIPAGVVGYLIQQAALNA